MLPQAVASEVVPGGVRISLPNGEPISKTLDADRLELELPAGARVRFDFAEAFSCALFTGGVLPSYAAKLETRELTDRLERFYTVARAGRSVSLDLTGAETVATRIVHTGLEAGTGLELDLADGRSHRIVLEASPNAYPAFAAAGVAISDPEALRTHLTALWGTVVGALGGADVPGSSYPTLPIPTRVYGELHTFFDPDTWMVVSCLAYSGDAYLQGEARAIIERSRAAITPAGQVPHHFDVEDPCYVAISEAAQSGPNLFWPIAVLEYVAATGDQEYLRELAPDLVRALDWVLNTLDPEYHLLDSVGPLWVDVFRREGLTLDTNAMAVLVLNRTAAALRVIDQVATAERFEALAAEIATAIGQLWRGDHYATALDTPGREPMPDLIDSDDVIAVLAGVADDEQAEKILARVAATMHPGGKGTWVSGRRYEADRCYLGNTGDSDCTMARIWWAEMVARRDRGDRTTFLALFRAVQADLLANVWMGERYGSQGQMIRAFGYHEYPGTVDVLLREGVYGLKVDVGGIDVRPMADGDFDYRVGALAAVRAGESWELTLPGNGPRSFTFHDLAPSGGYQWNGVAVTADAAGRLVLTGAAGSPQRLTR